MRVVHSSRPKRRTPNVDCTQLVLFLSDLISPLISHAFTAHYSSADSGHISEVSDTGDPRGFGAGI